MCLGQTSRKDSLNLLEELAEKDDVDERTEQGEIDQSGEIKNAEAIVAHVGVGESSTERLYETQDGQREAVDVKRALG